MRNRLATIVLLVLISGCGSTPRSGDGDTVEAALADCWDRRARRRHARDSLYEAAFAWAMAARIEPEDERRRNAVEWALRHMRPSMWSEPCDWLSGSLPMSPRQRLVAQAREDERVRQRNHTVLFAVIAEPVLALDERFLTSEQRDRAFAAAPPLAPLPPPPPPCPEATIIALRGYEDGTLLLLDRGADHGVVVDDRFEVRREGRRVALLRVAKVMPDMSGCWVESPPRVLLFSEGDRAVHVP